MTIWQADFYKRPLKDDLGQILWELLICDAQGQIITSDLCSQRDATVDWLVSKLDNLIKTEIPEAIEVFRPQSYSLLLTAAQKLNLKVIPTRHTTTLKKLLLQRTEDYHIFGNIYNPLKFEKQVPQPLPDKLLGEQWRFCAIAADELMETFADAPIPILEMPEALSPLNLGIASTAQIPGIIIYGGKQSMQLASWLQTEQPVSLNYIVTEIGESGGLIIEAGLDQRWILATFSDTEVAQSAQIYEQRKQQANGLHFLLVQPDDSGMTSSGFWLLINEFNN